MSIRFTRGGVLNTIQDLGRFRHRRGGINPGGAMDRGSLRILNILLGNDENEAAIELHFPAGELVFELACTFAITGADLGSSLNGVPVDTWRTYPAAAGDVLHFSKRLVGQRAYLGVAGGFKIHDWLGSRSTNLAARVGGFCGRPLAVNDRLDFNKRQWPEGPVNVGVGNSIVNGFHRSGPIRFTAGPEYSSLTPLAAERLLTERYRISNDSNRMGYRLVGESLSLLGEIEMISTAVEFGTIQLLPSGQIVILMADHQTTGGYPRIGQIIASDLPRLAQLSAGDDLSFGIASLSTAEKLDLDFERHLALLRVGRRFKVGE